MAKKILLTILVVTALLVFASCGNGGGGAAAGAGAGADAGAGAAANGGAAAQGEADGDAAGVDYAGTLRVMSFTNDSLVWATAFQGQHPGVVIDFQETPMEGGQFQDMLMTNLATGVDIPDVVALEAAFVREFVESPFLEDLSDFLPYADAIGMYPFVIEAATHEGAIKAWAFHATPGAMAFRRSLAIEYFGTDDIDYIQSRFSNVENLLESGRQIRDMSGGSTVVLASHVELVRMFQANRTQPWVVNGNLTIDPVMVDYINFAHTLRSEGMDAQASAFTDAWFAGMNDTLADAAGNPIQVFAYTMPPWGLTYVLVPNASTDTTDTTGDWGMIPGPMVFYWGGTWFAVPQGASNPELAREFIRFVLSEDAMFRWATGEFSNEYLRTINPDLPSGIGQVPGDFMAADVVARRVMPLMADSLIADFLAGQNPHDMFAHNAPYISLDLMQGTDQHIHTAFNDSVDLLLAGVIDTVDDVLQEFRNAVSVAVPGVNVN